MLRRSYLSSDDFSCLFLGDGDGDGTLECQNWSETPYNGKLLLFPQAGTNISLRTWKASRCPNSETRGYGITGSCRRTVVSSGEKILAVNDIVVNIWDGRLGDVGEGARSKWTREITSLRLLSK